MTTYTRVKCRFCGHVLPAWLTTWLDAEDVEDAKRQWSAR